MSFDPPDAFDQMTVLNCFQLLRQPHPKFDPALLDDVIDGLAMRPHLEKLLYMLSTCSKRKVWQASGDLTP